VWYYLRAFTLKRRLEEFFLGLLLPFLAVVDQEVESLPKVNSTSRENAYGKQRNLINSIISVTKNINLMNFIGFFLTQYRNECTFSYKFIKIIYFLNTSKDLI
jgi:hypothetical protein